MLAEIAAHGDGLLAEIKFLLHHSRRACADNDGVDTFFGDVLLNEGPSVGAAQTAMFHHLDARIGGRVFEPIYIEDIANATTSTKICTIYFFH
ncbi:hypothetical protein [Desulfobulbus propionicus]|uniref:hypothetical protein n=1 Tax=Desulfobulbus propionicus TaxID=894 RepID=UPI001FDF0392|nr:hypothetical protein [Desulfobulbus propionicus]